MAPLMEGASMTSRKLCIYQVCKAFSDRGADAVLIPCFASHTFREELQAELDIPLIYPADETQAALMNAVYGPGGIKAGHVSGQCRDEVLQAAAHLVEKGASVLILGCTERPLVLPHAESFLIASRHVSLIDPTDILAKRCVKLIEEAKPRPTAPAARP